MSKKGKQGGGGRKYPPIWEKLVPVLLWILAGIVLLLVLIVFAVVLGLTPGSA